MKLDISELQALVAKTTRELQMSGGSLTLDLTQTLSGRLFRSKLTGREWRVGKTLDKTLIVYELYEPRNYPNIKEPYEIREVNRWVFESDIESGELIEFTESEISPELLLKIKQWSRFNRQA